MPIQRFVALAGLIGCALLFRPAGTAHAAGDWLPIDPAELKMTSEPLAPGAKAIYLYRQVDRDDSGNARTEANYLRIKILTEEGRSLGNVQIAFPTEYMTVSNVRARTIRPDGSIVNFDGKVYESAIVKGQGVKYLAKTFTMPDVCVGGIIEYRFNYDFSNKWVVETNWELSGDLFTRRAKFSLKPCVSPGALLWKYPGGLPEGTQPPVQSPDHVFRMSVKNIPAFPTEDFIPPEYELKHSVVFFRTDEMAEEEPDKFWRNFDKKKVGQIEGFVDQRKAMEEAVGQILAASDAADVKLRKIYDRAQQVQNLSYETRKTEQEEKREKIKTASNVQEVWRTGGGDHEEIDWLFLALARPAGLEPAWLPLVTNISSKSRG